MAAQAPGAARGQGCALCSPPACALMGIAGALDSARAADPHPATARARRRRPGHRAAAAATACSGDGYLRAQLAGAIEALIDWPNSGTRCEGETEEQTCPACA